MTSSLVGGAHTALIIGWVLFQIADQHSRMALADLSTSPLLVAALCSLMRVSRALFISPMYIRPHAATRNLVYDVGLLLQWISIFDLHQLLLLSIYRKPTHPDRYLHFSFHHSRHVKEGVVCCLFHRARTVAQGENVKAEEEHLRGVLEGNGYPEAFLRTASKLCTVTEPTVEPRTTAFIPYVAGLSEDVRQVCRQYNIRTIFRLASTLRGQLIQGKD